MALSLAEEPSVAMSKCLYMADRLPADQHWNGAVGEDLHGLAAQQQSSQSAPAVRCYDDQVAAVLLRGVQDSIGRILVLGVNREQ